MKKGNLKIILKLTAPEHNVKFLQYVFLSIRSGPLSENSAVSLCCMKYTEI